MLSRCALLALLALAGCGEEPAPRPARADRVKAAEEAAAQPPRVQRHAVDGGELVILQVPVRIGRTLTDRQTCYVWRDAEYRTASLQCPAGEDGEPAADAAPPEPHQP